MNPPPESPHDTAAIWMARRDRGLSAAEQDAYLQWLREDPANGAAVAHLEKTWDRLNQLGQWRPAHSPRPNPDLLAPRRTHRWVKVWGGAFAAAAAIALLALLWRPAASAPPPVRTAVIHPGPERLALEDGSIVELNTGAKVDVNFTAGERRVHLLRGEAHFVVAKNPARPFIVSADNLFVRAVGTAFSVQLDRAAVSVLVTEGKVRLDESTAGASPNAEPHELSHLVAGQQAVVTRSAAAGGAASLQIREFTPAEIDRAIAWQGLRLGFEDMRLADVVNEFNRYNVRKLVVGDRATADILVAGNFRADNVDTFVRFLDEVFGVTASTRGNQIVLWRRR